MYYTAHYTKNFLRNCLSICFLFPKFRIHANPASPLQVLGLLPWAGTANTTLSHPPGHAALRPRGFPRSLCSSSGKAVEYPENVVFLCDYFLSNTCSWNICDELKPSFSPLCFYYHEEFKIYTKAGRRVSRSTTYPSPSFNNFQHTSLPHTSYVFLPTTSLQVVLD